MDSFKTKIKPFSGTSYADIYPKALYVYKNITSKTKRRPYLRSAYFSKEKVFLDYFWDHIREKNLRDRARRLTYYACALDLIKHSRMKPSSKENPNKKSEVLHRFTGITGDRRVFCVQIIKERLKRREKYFMSVFSTE